MESSSSFQGLRYILILILLQLLTIVFAIGIMFSFNLHICEDLNNNSIEVVPEGKLLHVPMFGKFTNFSRNSLYISHLDANNFTNKIHFRLETDLF